MADASPAAGAGVGGGAIYDALVGLPARAAGATLITFDRHAEPTYRALEVDYRLAGWSAAPGDVDAGAQLLDVVGGAVHL